ncbi:MAG: type II toxin-antitoxin system HipA family toxin [Acidimicrobiia bacterium]|nr:type II toxin-antitoxin system HipA family toxin [Acidimicrobiia bacterium]
MADELHIWIAECRVGVLTAGADRRRLKLAYEPDWSDEPTATPLSVSMPLVAHLHTGDRVANWLWGLLPDDDRVLRRWASENRCSPSDIFGLLRGVGADVAGAARWLPPGVDPASEPTSMPVSTSDVGQMLRDLRSDTTRWHPELGGRWSLAGAQAKLALAAVERPDRSIQWSLPAGSAPTTHILKPAIAGLDHHDLNEHLCLRAAENVGLISATSWVEHFDGEPALVITRYDRRATDHGVQRVHQEDLCQALGVHPTRKYESDGGVSFVEMARLVDEVVDARARTRTLHRLGMALAYNWLILGTDAHAKNYSLLLSGPQVRMAPLYDLASAALSGMHPTDVKLAQKVGGEYRATVVGRRHWERVAALVGIGVDEFVADVTRMAEKIPDAFADAVAATIGLGSAEKKTAAVLVDGVAAWSRECSTRLRAAGD